VSRGNRQNPGKVGFLPVFENSGISAPVVSVLRVAAGFKYRFGDLDVLNGDAGQVGNRDLPVNNRKSLLRAW
jgi:hypothetical protein